MKLKNGNPLKIIREPQNEGGKRKTKKTVTLGSLPMIIIETARVSMWHHTCAAYCCSGNHNSAPEKIKAHRNQSCRPREFQKSRRNPEQTWNCDGAKRLDWNWRNELRSRNEEVVMSEAESVKFCISESSKACPQTTPLLGFICFEQKLRTIATCSYERTRV